mmetsp:Transcript_33036/g.53225  ORF Transcript_33036/g.53225 Transcript_33036/m.53225 type:complete len:123 (-) Transcript_33036:1307-1675(-)
MKYKHEIQESAITTCLPEPLVKRGLSSHGRGYEYTYQYSMNGDDVQVVGQNLNLNQRMRVVMAHECEMSVRESCHRTRQVLPVTRKVVLSRPLCRPIDDAVPMHYVGYFVSNHPTATALRRD